MRRLAAWYLLALCACPTPPTQEPDAGPSTTDCLPGTFKTAAGVCQAAGANCGVGFTRAASGWGCEAVLETCAAGSMSVPGEACTAVGWSRCPPGFTRDPSGWTCAPVIASAPCTGATRTALGSASCQPVGDCAAPFPPAAATLFVDAAGAVDATHFNRIADALAVAPAGATIAIGPGSYAESLTLRRPVKLVGRCAAQVTLTGNPALNLVSVQGVEVDGVTVRDSLLAARLELAAGLTLRHVVLEANLRSAIQALDPGTSVTLEDVVIRGTRPDPTTQTFGQGIAASYGARLTATDVELSGNGETALFLDRAGTSASLTRAVVAGTLPRASTGKLGWGIAVQGGAVLDGDTVLVQDNRVTGVLVAQTGSRVTLKDTLVRRTAVGPDNVGAPTALGVSVLQGAALSWTGGGAEDALRGLVLVGDATSTATLSNFTARRGGGALTGSPFGLNAETNAKLSLDHVAILEVAGAGLLALSGSEVAVDHVAIFDTTRAGLQAQDAARIIGASVEVRRHGLDAALVTEQGALSLTGCVLADAVTGPDGGLSGTGLAVGRAAAQLERCLLDQNATAGVYAKYAGAQVTVSASVVTGTRLQANGEFGQGAVAEQGARIDLEDVTLSGNHTAGVQVADTGSLLSLLRTTVRGTVADITGMRGRGANANFDGELQVRDSAFVDNGQVGIFVFQSRAELIGTLVQGTRADPDGRFGNGVEVLTDGVVYLTGGAIEGNAGLGAVFAEGAGLLDGVRVAANPVGLHAQDGSTVEELAQAPAVLGARQVVITTSTAFEGNQAKVSAGTVPVPPR